MWILQRELREEVYVGTECRSKIQNVILTLRMELVIHHVQDQGDMLCGLGWKVLQLLFWLWA